MKNTTLCIDYDGNDFTFIWQHYVEMRYYSFNQKKTKIGKKPILAIIEIVNYVFKDKLIINTKY